MTPDKGRGISGALTDPPTLLWRATVRVRLLLGGNVCPRQVLGPGQCHAFVPTETGPGLYDGLHRILPTHYQDGSYGTPLGSYARLVNPGDQTLPALHLGAGRLSWHSSGFHGIFMIIVIGRKRNV